VTFGILGNKLGMTQIFDKIGNATPATIIKAGPCRISQIKTVSKEGYQAVQLAYEEISNKKNSLSKPVLGHFSKKNLPPFRYIREFKLTEKITPITLGQEVSVDIFRIGQFLNVKGSTIGKGNTSNIKRNHFSRGPMSHGSKHHRLQGSLGAGTSPGRVFPGKKMPGRMGAQNRTIKNLELIYIDKINNLLVVKGSVPGKTNNLLIITPKN
jgi:large subunit ribosomal protein L3